MVRRGVGAYDKNEIAVDSGGNVGVWMFCTVVCPRFDETRCFECRDNVDVSVKDACSRKEDKSWVSKSVVVVNILLIYYMVVIFRKLTCIVV